MLLYIVSLFTAAFYFWLSILAFQKWKKGEATRWFAFLLLFGGLWLVVIIAETYIYYNPPIGVQSLIYIGKADYILSALIALCMAMFAIHFPVKNKMLKRIYEIVLYVPIIGAIVMSAAGLVVGPGAIKRVDHIVPGYWVYIAIICVYFIGIALITLVRKYRNSVGLSKLQLKYITPSYGVSIVVLLAMSIGNAIWGINDIVQNWMADIMLLFILGSAYAVLKYRLFGLRYAIKKGIVHVIVYLMLVLFYGYAAILINNVIIRKYQWESMGPNLVLVLFITLTIFPIRRWLVKSIGSLIFERIKSTKSIIKEVREKISGSVELDKLFASLTAEIEKVVAVKEIKYFIVNKRARLFDQVGGGQAMPPEASLPQWFKDTQNILVRDEIAYLIQELPIVNQPLLERCQKELEEAHSEMAIPFGSKNNLLGFAMLGEKANEESYTKEEIDLLQAVGREATYALDGAILYKEALERIGVTT